MAPVSLDFQIPLQEMKNPSFVLKSIDKVAFEDRPVPEVKDPHSVLLQVNYTGICGSDVHYWCNGRIGHFVVKKPMVLGHESAGTVIEVGSKVKSLEKGDRVAMEPGIPCRCCTRCKEGKYNLCAAMAFAATPPYDGTLAKYYVLPEDLCYKLPENVSLEEGALLEPLSVAVHLVRQSGIKYGDSIAVFGAGPIGLLCCAVAKAYGARKIISVDIQKQRLEFAKQFAATATFEPGKGSAQEDAQRLIQENDLGSGADVAIEASGAEPSIQTAIHVLRQGGSYVQGGMGRDSVSFPIITACTKELTVRGSFRYGPEDYKTALDMVARGTVRVKDLISKTVAFEDAQAAFRDTKCGKIIKVLISGPP
ncbi:D-xylulose reductase A [Dendryphion nanum]|uniref:D-xylulose reductase n=1 Tax=Dendryphion nanum TaxID=256645 RepID=A0A9P9CZK1_9PLEO|nr:D-xylulose reductase A [Dendryphion nanum]